MNARVTGLLLSGLFLVAAAGHPVLADVVSGPTVDTEPKPFKVQVATGDDAGKEVDYVTQRRDQPTIFIFVQADRFDRPMARYLRTLDQELKEKRRDVKVVAIWMTDDVQKSKDYLPKAQQSLRFDQTVLAVFDGDRNAGPDQWGLNSDAHLTAVLVSGNKVDAAMGYRSLNETDVPDVMKKLKPAK
jgi:hypothetical protein